MLKLAMMQQLLLPHSTPSECLFMRHLDIRLLLLGRLPDCSWKHPWSIPNKLLKQI